MQVVRRLSEYSLSPPQSEEDLKPVDAFISEAYKVCPGLGNSHAKERKGSDAINIEAAMHLQSA